VVLLLSVVASVLGVDRFLRRTVSTSNAALVFLVMGLARFHIVLISKQIALWSTGARS